MKGMTTGENCLDCDCQCINAYFDSESIEEFAGSVKSIHYKKGETIIKQGTFNAEIAYLKKGLVKLFFESKNNKNTIYKILPSSTFISMNSLFMDEYHSFSASALKDCDVCLIKKETLSSMMKENKNCCVLFSQDLSAEIIGLFEKMTVLSTRNNHGKLSEALLKLSDPKLLAEDVFNYISRREIAEFATISIESTNKILNELKNDLIIKINDKGLEIVKPDLLERLSKIG